ncbi:MAG TPA: PKD domain-containing protein [Candidatus Saccharimonadales bacterium]|nr:PKD domain-containing protein [Candidatus Saccharimonadales bacterium]
MGHKLTKIILVSFLIALGVQLFLVSGAKALVNPQNGSIGLSGTISAPPPSTGATIITPSNGQSFSSEPITVAGLCPSGLLIEIFDNNIFAGSTNCTNGSYTLKIDLFSGQNSLVAIDYDALNQAGPSSATVSVSYSSGSFLQFGTLLTLTSSYAKRGANPGQQLTWPISLNGGTSPYALSINWGDGSTPQLLSEGLSGNITLSHTYAQAGTYTVTIVATDKNGEMAFLQVVAVANGPVKQSTASSSTTTKTVNKVIWWPMLIFIPIIISSFWLGRRYEQLYLRRNLSPPGDEF